LKDLDIGISAKETISGHYISILFVITALALPLVGIFIDKYGQRLRILLLACLFSICSHILLLFVQNSFPLVMLGLSYSLFGAAIWPIIPYIVKP